MSRETNSRGANDILPIELTNPTSDQAPADALNDLRFVTSEFQEHFSDFGYQQLASVAITAKLDRTVRFIGAPISVMKPLVTEERIPQSGVFMVQNCLRTSNVSTLLEMDAISKYGSLFTAMCGLTTYDKLDDLFAQTNEYFTQRLQIDKDDLYISIDARDEDLVSAARNPGDVEVSLDSQPPSLYRHKYGIDGIWGRNVSYWLKSQDNGVFEDVGNIIVIENDQGELGVELALGDTTLVKQTRGMKHVQDCYDLRLASASSPEPIRRKLEDAVLTSLALYSEGLRPSSRDNQTRILRSYLKSASLHSRLLGIEAVDLKERMTRLESGALPFDSRGQSEQIIDWITDYERNLEAKGPSNNEDKTIINIIGSFSLAASKE